MPHIVSTENRAEGGFSPVNEHMHTTILLKGHNKGRWPFVSGFHDVVLVSPTACLYFSLPSPYFTQPHCFSFPCIILNLAQMSLLQEALHTCKY